MTCIYATLVSSTMSGVAQLTKAFLRVKGPDSARFLNGLTTARLLPNVVKKKQHTVLMNENLHLDLLAKINEKENWGLMHEDVYDPDQNIFVQRDGVYSMFLNSRGRVLNDCFMYAFPFHTASEATKALYEEGPSYLLEVAPKYLKSLQLLLRMHKLSAKVKFEVPQYHSYYYYSDTPQFEELLDGIYEKYAGTTDPAEALESANAFIQDQKVVSRLMAGNVVGLALDNRIPNFGIKIVTDTPVDPVKLFSDEFRAEFQTNVVPEAQVTKRRFVNGLFETADAPEGQLLLPFEANLDYVNGISLDKGCYVGQELTIRTYNSRIFRKRVFPVTFDRDVGALIGKEPVNQIFVERVEQEGEQAELNGLAASPFGQKKVSKRPKTAAKVLAVDGNLGFMLATVEDVEKGIQFRMKVKDETVHVETRVPEWWPM